MNYITIEQAIEIHNITIEVSGGGESGVLDTGRLESVLEHIQNDDYYPTFEEKLTHLFFCADNFHCFVDGNKRIAIALGAQFLILNGYLFIVKIFLQEMENISYHVAAGKINKDLLHNIIYELVNHNQISDDLKLEIFNAIKDEE